MYMHALLLCTQCIITSTCTYTFTSRFVFADHAAAYHGHAYIGRATKRETLLVTSYPMVSAPDHMPLTTMVISLVFHQCWANP